MKLHEVEQRVNELLKNGEGKGEKKLNQFCEVICNSQQIKEKAAQIAEESARTKKEAAFSVCGNEFPFESGDERGVSVPQCKLGSPKLVMHTHTVTPSFSDADKKASQSYPVCMVYNGKIKCMYKGEVEECNQCPINQ